MSHVNLRRVKHGRYVSLAAKINLIHLLSLCVTSGCIGVSILLPPGVRDSMVAQTVESACSVGEPGSIPGLGRSPGEWNGNPLQYFCQENPMNGGAWQAT